MTGPYHYAGDGDCFVIEQYNDRVPFAGFLPGVAGFRGRPAWVFYVNRGQGVASFGVRNKDGAFLEFHPADKACQLTPARGFRTFVKIVGCNDRSIWEPFQCGPAAGVRQRMYVAPHEVGVEEIDPHVGLGIRADTFTLPEAAVAAVVRRVEIVNNALQARTLQVVDGLPQVLPWGLNQWVVKFMSRTSEAFMRVEGVHERLPFYRLQVWPTDSPQVERVVAGNFFAGFLDGKRTAVLVDPERVFGMAGDLSRPLGFGASAHLALGDQVIANRTPAAFQVLDLELQPGERRVFYGIYGHADSREALERFVPGAGTPGCFEAMRDVNRRLVADLSRRAFTLTARPLFDAHVRQSYLDNGLRGGFPTEVPGGAELYLFGRKHGDLERDYNDFLLQDTPFSEGNGDFRDVLQNRRVDLFFAPGLDAKNIRYFFNLIQPDGYNPCSLRNTRFAVHEPQALAHCVARFPALAPVLASEFKYAEMWQAIATAEDPETLAGEILAHAEEVEDAEFDRGYWSDHWTYLVDLLIQYAALFPDRLAGLFTDADYSFFDPTHFVAPRVRKHVVTPAGVRQYGAVLPSEEKRAMLAARRAHRYKVRARAGQGEIVRTTLLGKILTLVANKLATLDPFGVGVEMEADRPGWCDALNGLPGIFGSSVNETIELKRLVDFTLRAMPAGEDACTLPEELAVFVSSLGELLHRSSLTPVGFWRESGALKESYRASVFMGFSGVDATLPLAAVRRFLADVSAFLDGAVARARTPRGIVTYFSYEVVAYEQSERGVEVVSFRQRPLPMFLEGFVHAMRIATAGQARALYEAVRASDLFDRELGMYRLNAPLGDNALELGRIGVFNYGWLENGSIFLHMHYKWVLEMVRAGLVAEFHADIEKLLVGFRDPAEYGRNPAENSSFLVSSGFAADPRQHGRGCVARLSGATVEMLHLWIHLFLGEAPFGMEDGELLFRPAPALSEAFFTSQAQRVNPFGTEEAIPAGSAVCTLWGSTLLVYLNPARRDTFGPEGVQPVGYALHARDGGTRAVQGRHLRAADAEALRAGRYRRVDVLLGDEPHRLRYWLTTADRGTRFERQPHEPAFGGGRAGLPVVAVDPERRFQRIDGFGFSLTGASALLISRLGAAQRQTLLRELFLPDGPGVGVSFLRLTIGASDLSERSFSCDDRPAGEDDFALAHFDVAAGDREVIPLLREILAINPALRIIATPWSAPPWMKTNRGFVGGKLRRDCYAVYAAYFVRYIVAMRESGVTVQAITPQNEPLNQKNEPSMVMEALEQAEFVREHLGPALARAGLQDVEVFCWDHNCDRIEYPLTVFADPGARRYLSGSAWHLYGGDISALSVVHDAHPGMKLYFTEQWVGSEGQFGPDLLWHARHVLIGSLCNWSAAVFEWNLASDPACGPHTPGGEARCVGALTIGEGISRNVAYYVIAHASKFIRPGSVRIFSRADAPLRCAAFLTPEEGAVLLVLNEAEQPRAFCIGFRGRYAEVTLPARALATCVWPAACPRSPEPARPSRSAP